VMGGISSEPYGRLMRTPPVAGPQSPGLIL
jgi:hypothetical protein